jgi:hypothetical protein
MKKTRRIKQRRREAEVNEEEAKKDKSGERK